VKKKYVLVS
jgi:hypothetical protein